MKSSEFITESAANNITGPFKVTGYDPSTRTVSLEGFRDVVLDKAIKDKPTVGYNCSFKLAGRTATMLLCQTADTIIHTNNEVLLIKRKGNPFAGHWAIPGGFIEPGEQPIDAAKRELHEETGLVINDLKFVGLFNAPGRDPRMENIWTYAFKILVTDKPQAKAGDDASAAQWIPINKLATLNLAFDHKQILAKAGIR